LVQKQHFEDNEFKAFRNFLVVGQLQTEFQVSSPDSKNHRFYFDVTTSSESFESRAASRRFSSLSENFSGPGSHKESEEKFNRADVLTRLLAT
jgi:hypothetical protein